jgi:hypothetical protein
MVLVTGRVTNRPSLHCLFLASAATSTTGQSFMRRSTQPIVRPNSRPRCRAIWRKANLVQYWMSIRGIHLAPPSYLGALRDPLHDVAVCHRIGDHGLLQQSVEEHSPGAGGAAIEAENVFVKVGVEMPRLN